MGRSTLVLPPGDVDNGRQLEYSQEGGGGTTMQLEAGMAWEGG